MREFIVAEITTNWPKPWPIPRNEYLGAKFEEMIARNLERGYILHSFQLNQLKIDAETLSETIIAVFERTE